MRSAVAPRCGRWDLSQFSRRENGTVPLYVTLILILGAILGLGGCGNPTQQAPPGDASQPSEAKTFENVRGPAVAGMFYPRHKEDLEKEIDQYLADAKPEPVANLRGLVSPHAGYEYSGHTAGFSYKLLKGRDIQTAIILAPSHTARFEGASIPDVDAYETPLGMIPLSPKAAELAAIKPFVVNPSCEVHRPQWWRRAPKALPPFGEDTPHSWEHSIEVQLPFLQRTLGDFSIVPVVYGDVDPEAVARVLAKQLDDKTIIVASSDLSHYLPYDVAKGLDTTCVKAICSLNTQWMKQQDACGKAPILTLMHIARQKEWKARLLDYRNSGDTAGEKSGVVGYAAIAFYAPGGAISGEKPTAQADKAATVGRAASPASFTSNQRRYLLELARRTVDKVVIDRKLPEVGMDAVSEEFLEPAAVFVTLTKEGRLRGCIGDIFPRRPLYQAVIFSAAGAAAQDRRFPPVQPSELDQIEIEVSVLTVPERLEFSSPEELLGKLRPKVDGVVLRVGRKKSTYLPQVWEQLPEKEEFLNRLAEKAELPPSAWKNADATILIYQVKAFKEKESER